MGLGGGQESDAARALRAGLAVALFTASEIPIIRGVQLRSKTFQRGSDQGAGPDARILLYTDSLEPHTVPRTPALSQPQPHPDMALPVPEPRWGPGVDLALSQQAGTPAGRQQLVGKGREGKGTGRAGSTPSPKSGACTGLV